jgi:hypothetical protein
MESPRGASCPLTRCSNPRRNGRQPRLGRFAGKKSDRMSLEVDPLVEHVHSFSGFVKSKYWQASSIALTLARPSVPVRRRSVAPEPSIACRGKCHPKIQVPISYATCLKDRMHQISCPTNILRDRALQRTVGLQPVTSCKLERSAVLKFSVGACTLFDSNSVFGSSNSSVAT